MDAVLCFFYNDTLHTSFPCAMPRRKAPVMRGSTFEGWPSRKANSWKWLLENNEVQPTHAHVVPGL